MNVAVDNFPIYKETRSIYLPSFSVEPYINYLKSYSDHKIRAQFNRKGFFSSDHRYEDGLHINIVWRYDCSESELKKKVNGIDMIEDIVFLFENKYIELVFADVWGYSNPKADFEMSGFLLEEDKNIEGIEICEKKQYQALEYQTTEPVNIPDSFFETLIEETSNYIKFEEYIKNRV